MKNYTIDHITSTIVCTKAFLKEAGIYNSEAYNILKGLRADFPTFGIVQREIKKNSSKKTYGKLTYERMEKYIIFVEGKETETLKEFKAVKTKATFKASPYAYTKKWFLDRYKDFADNAEQVEEAEEQVQEIVTETELTVMESQAA